MHQFLHIHSLTHRQMHSNTHTEASTPTTIMQKQNLVPPPYLELCTDSGWEQNSPNALKIHPNCVMLGQMYVDNLSYVQIKHRLVKS